MRAFIFLLLVSNCLHAQLIRFDTENIATDDRYFSPGFLRVNNIRNATVEFSRKEEGERIENLLKRWIYFFDQEGRVSRIIKVDNPMHLKPDSSFVYYYYTPQGNIRIRRTLHHGQYKGEYFEHDSLGRILKIVVTRENNFGSTAENFKPAQQEIQFLETYQYERLTKEQEKTRVMNDNGIVYKEGMKYYNGPYLIEKDMRYVITGLRQNEKFDYDSKQRISKYTYFTDAAGDLKEAKAATYDEATGNLKILDLFKNGEHTNQVFYFYDKKNLLLEGEVNKELKTGVLHLRNYKFNSLKEEPSPSRQ